MRSTPEQSGVKRAAARVKEAWPPIRGNAENQIGNIEHHLSRTAGH
jgi:hypothetical protein